MSFLSSFFLYALPAAAVPILIHLLAKRRKKVIPWGAMQFLAQANPRDRRSWRLKDLLLMLLRVSLLACFIFALARPLVPAGWLGGHDTRDLIVVLDQSLSTHWDHGGETAYERELTLLETALKDFESTDYLRCIVARDQPNWLTRFPLQADAASKSGLIEQLREQGPGTGSANLLAGVEEAWSAEPAHPRAQRHVLLITDGQAHGWMMEQSGRWMAVAQQVESAPSGSVMRTLRAPRGGEESLDNLALTALTPNRTVVALGEPVELIATVHNFGAAPSPSSVLRWYRDESESLGLATVPALDPGASTALKLEQALETLGVHAFSARLESGDGLAVDDEATAYVEVAAGIPVLIVEETDGPADGRASQYLEAALGAFGGEDTGVFRGRRVRPSALAEVKLSDYRVIILLQHARLPPTVIEALHGFVRRGGGLWLAPAADTDPGQFNALFAQRSFPLAPARLDSALGQTAQETVFERVSPPTQVHPATILLSDTERLDLDEIRIHRRFTYASPLPADLSVLLRVGSGDPLVVEKSLGKGRVLQQAVPLDRQWSNLPSLQVYVALVYEWLWYLAQPGLPQFNLARGQVYEIPLPERPVVDAVKLTTPDGATRSVSAVLDLDGRKHIRVADTTAPGEYRVLFSTDGRVLSTHPFRVERDWLESDLTPLNAAMTDQLRARAHMVFGDESARGIVGQASPADRRQEPLWFWLLMGVLLFLVAESALAWSIARSRNISKPGARLSAAR